MSLSSYEIVTGLRFSCPETVIEYLRGAVPVALRQAREWVRCGNFINTAEVLWAVWSAFDHICAIGDYYVKRPCVQGAPPFPDIPGYRGIPFDVRGCYYELFRGVNGEEFVRVVGHILGCIDYFESVFYALMTLLDEARVIHDRCVLLYRGFREHFNTYAEVEECISEYQRFIFQVKELAWLARRQLGVITSLGRRVLEVARGSLAEPRVVIGGCSGLLNYLYKLGFTYNRRFGVRAVNRFVWRVLMAEALNRISSSLADAHFELARRLCAGMGLDFFGGYCGRLTLGRINEVYRRLVRWRERGWVTPARFNSLVSELERLCRDVGGEWREGRCERRRRR